MYKRWIIKVLIKDIEILLERTKQYYKNNKLKLQEQVRNKYRELSNEEKNKENIEKTDTKICLKQISKD